jgi:hypothetical protein
MIDKVCDTEKSIYKVVMLSFFMLNLIICRYLYMLNVVMLNDIMLMVVKLNDIMFIAVMLKVLLPNLLARERMLHIQPYTDTKCTHCTLEKST